MKLKPSFKKLLAALGLATIVVPASMSVVGCDLKEIIGSAGGNQSTNKLVVKAINSTTFTLGIEVGLSKAALENTVCVKFIGNRLPEKIKKLYDSSLFIQHDINNEEGESLSDEDLESPKIINAKIIYSYAEFENQTTNLRLTIVKKK